MRQDVPANVTIVGAGLAGLAAALRLEAAGATVRVVDPLPPGGKARTIEVAPGWTVERGPHSFTSRAEPLFTLAAEVGLAEGAPGGVARVGAQGHARYLARGGRLRKAGPKPGALTLGEMFGVLRGIFRSVPESAPDATVEDWLACRFGRSFAQGPAAAFTVGIWGARPSEVEMAAAFPAIVEALRGGGSILSALLRARREAREHPATGPKRPSGTWGFAGGMGALTEAAARRLGAGVFVQARVTGLTRLGDGWRVEAEGDVWSTDAVVIATEAPVAADLLATIAPDVVAPLRAIRYSPLLVAHWMSPADASGLPHGFGWLAPPSEGRGALGSIFVSDLRPAAVPAGMRSFATMFGGTPRPEDARLGDQEVRARLLTELRGLTGQEPTLAGLHVIRHPAAVPIPAPGHQRRVAAAQAALPRGLALAGAWCGMGAMHEAIRAGVAAAERLAPDGGGGAYAT